MKMILRNYQQKAIEQMRERIATGQNRLILCSPTGSGKTVIFSHLAKSALEKGKKVLIVTDRIDHTACSCPLGSLTPQCILQ